jgi:hypothetical protein
MHLRASVPEFTRSPGHGRFMEILNPKDTERLEVFYLGLDFDQRRQRFGGGISDTSIKDYCRKFNWQRAIVIARASSYLLDTVCEIHPCASWEKAEIAVCCPLGCDRSRIFSELFQLGALTAGALGCTKFVAYDNVERFEDILILRTLGRTVHDKDSLTIDISEYSIAHPRRL